MSNVSRQIYGKNIHFHGDASPVTLGAPDSSLALEGTVNIVDSADGSDAGLTIEGTDILDYIGTPVTYNTIATHALTTTDSFIIAESLLFSCLKFQLLLELKNTVSKLKAVWSSPTRQQPVAK